MSPAVRRRDALARVPGVLGRLAVGAVPLVATSVALTACTSSAAIGGCWEAAVGDDRTVSFFVDTDDDTVLGAETSGEGDDAVRTEFEGRIGGEGDSYRIDAACTGSPTGCEGVADWSLRCTLDESGAEPILRCSGAPFAGETALTTCQGSATVPTP